MKRAKIITVINMKGGVAKTLTTQMIGYGLARNGYRVLLVDSDPQGNLTSLILPEIDFTGLELKDGRLTVEALRTAKKNYEMIVNGNEKVTDNKTLSDLLQKSASVEDCIYHTCYEGLDIIPSDLGLSTLIYDLQSNAANGMPQLRLKKELKYLPYDVIVIDNSPSLNIMTVNSVYASRVVLIPTTMDQTSISGMLLTLIQCNKMIDELDHDRDYKFMILGTMMNRTKYDRDASEALREVFGSMYFSTVIRYQSAPIRRARISDKLLLDDKKSAVAAEYNAFISELMEKL